MTLSKQARITVMEDLSTQIKDLVNQQSPQVSRAMLVQATAQALGNAAHNATYSQQQHNVLIKTNTAIGANLILSLGAKYAKA